MASGCVWDARKEVLEHLGTIPGVFVPHTSSGIRRLSFLKNCFTLKSIISKYLIEYFMSVTSSCS